MDPVEVGQGRADCEVPGRPPYQHRVTGRFGRGDLRSAWGLPRASAMIRSRTRSSSGPIGTESSSVHRPARAKFGLNPKTMHVSGYLGTFMVVIGLLFTVIGFAQHRGGSWTRVLARHLH